MTSALGRFACAGLFVLAMSGRADAACTVSVTGVFFGTYDVFSAAPLDSTGTIAIGGCNKALQINVTRGTSSSFDPRTMRSAAAEILAYNLFLDAARSVIWGDGTNGTQIYSNANPGKNPFTLTVYGRIAAGQDVTSGQYADLVTVTMNF